MLSQFMWVMKIFSILESLILEKKPRESFVYLLHWYILLENNNCWAMNQTYWTREKMSATGTGTSGGALFSVNSILTRRVFYKEFKTQYHYY